MDGKFFRWMGCNFLVLSIGVFCLTATDRVCAAAANASSEICTQAGQAEYVPLQISALLPSGPSLFEPEPLVVLHFEQNTLLKKFSGFGFSPIHLAGRNAGMESCQQYTTCRRSPVSCQFMCKLQI